MMMNEKLKPKTTEDILISKIHAQKELTKRDCQDVFYNFLQFFWSSIIPEPLIDNWHIKYLCDELQIIGERIVKRQNSEYDLIINVPPGTSKSTIATIMFPAWLWLKDATLRIISGSYSSDIAIDHAVKSRNILKSFQFEELYGDLFQFSRDQDNKSYYQNTKGGTRAACGVGGSITGKHGHCLIIDDPINPKQSSSEVYRKSVNDWMDKTLSTRKVDKLKTPTIIIMQRLHEDDPSGYRLNKGKVKHICIPSELSDLDNVSPKELEEFYEDGLMDSIRMNREALSWEREMLGSVEYAGQFLQSPMAAEGNLIKRKWFGTYNNIPENKPLRIVQSWDTAIKDKETNDFWSCTTWFEYPNGFVCVNTLNEKMTYPDAKKRFASHSSDWFPHVILIPDTDAGQILIQEMALISKFPIYAVTVSKDKVSNAQTASPLMEAGKVYLLESMALKNVLLDQLCGFPNVKNDDMVDTVTQFLNWVREHPFSTPFAVGRGGRQTNKMLRGYNYGERQTSSRSN